MENEVNNENNGKHVDQTENTEISDKEEISLYSYYSKKQKR